MKISVCVAVSLFILAAGMMIFTQLGWNLLGLTIFREYTIPTQSSIFTFKPIEWFEEGSGDWWTYGEDGTRFYYWEEIRNGEYKSITKADAKMIQSFSPTNHLTWTK